MSAPDTSTKRFQDPWGTWVARIVRKRNQFLIKIWTIYVRLNCLFWKINIGKNCQFWGKTYFYRAPGSSIEIGKNCEFRSSAWSNMIGINRKCSLSTKKPHAKIMIGDRTGMSGTTINADNYIEIGSDVLCGANTTIIDTDWHQIKRSKKNLEPPSSAPVIIGSNVWLGMNVVILKGVTIGANTIIAANSLVTKDIPENVIAAGQPARIVKYL